jgi:hypothetical protein
MISITSARPVRGEARDDSDYEIAVFPREFKEPWPEVDRLVEIETDLLYETGAMRPDRKQRCHWSALPQRW